MLDPAGGLAPEMAQVMGAKDVLVAISFRHYAKEVVAIADVAAQNGTPRVVITDSQLSPLAKSATALFTVPEDEYSFAKSRRSDVSDNVAPFPSRRCCERKTGLRRQCLP
ncbi:MurR/RpiR family transcriptional regulator [Rhizobium leguminosarum]|uniref:MurR/RpiR family transcriptional regulator n=1 Tax=Rhizobium leguminosarum TaxID=384 RepID=UPI001FE0E624|nr:SIS domain-containing protein [Rhizobium leguminosarum]